MPDLTSTRADVKRLLKSYLRASEDERTPIYRSLAEHLVDARAHFTRSDGSPDWKGRSYPYRTWLRDVFVEAGIPKDVNATVQAAIRYHVGAVLRERLDEETLADYGLSPKTPKEQSADRRANRSALLNAINARDLAGGSLMAITTAHTILSKIAPKDVDELDGHAAEVADAALADLERRAKTLRRRLNSDR